MDRGFRGGRAVWLLAGLSGCASSWGDAPLETVSSEAKSAEAKSPEAVEAAERVVVTLQARDAELTLTSTSSGIRYSVRDARGTLQAALTLEQLQERDPHLYELARSATARSFVAGQPSFVDASLFGLRAAPPGADGPALETRRLAPRR